MWRVENASVGWAVGDYGTILRTTDGNGTWNDLDPGFRQTLCDVYFVDHDNGWAAGNSGIVERTTDGRKTWSGKNVGSSAALAKLDFINSGTGWVGGSNGFVAKTTDGGQSWQKENLGASQSIRDLYLLNKDAGYVLADSIYKTTDGGYSWSMLHPGVSPVSIDFVNPDTGWVLAPSYGIEATNDGGTTWKTISAYSPISGFDGPYSLCMFALDNLHIWIGAIYYNNMDGGANTLTYRTTDGGVSWEPLEFDSGGWQPGTIFFADSSIGWVLTDRTGANIYYTCDGGLSWHPQLNCYSGLIHSLHFVDDSTGWAVGSGGLIMKMQSNGPTGV